MKTTWILSKIYYKELIGGFISKNTMENGKKRGRENWKKLLFLLIPVFLYPQVFLLSHYLYSGFKDIGAGTSAISVAYLIAALFSFFTIFTSVISNLGGDKVLAQLSSLPIQARQIFSARMLLFYFITLVETIYLLSPIAIFYAMDFGWYTLPISLVVGTMIPIIPMSLALLVIMPFAKLFAKSRLKKLMPYVLNIGFFVAYLAFMGGASKMQLAGSSMAEVFYGIVQNIYPPAAWGGHLVAGDLMSGLYFLLIHIAVLVIVYFVSGFFASVVLDENNFATEKRGKAVLRTRSVLSGLIRRQFGIMISSHRFVLQCLGSLITMPILFVFYIYAGLFDFKSLAGYVHQLDFGVVVIFITVFAPTLTSSIGISSVAREGRTFWENKVLPISGKQQVLSRFLFTMLLDLPVGLITAIGAMIVFEISVFETLIGILSGIGYVAFVNSMDHFIDIRFPNLDWTSEMQAVKNSKTIGIAVLLKMIFAFGTGFAMYFVSQKFGVMTTVWSALILGMLLGIVGVFVLMTKGVKLFDRIDA